MISLRLLLLTLLCLTARAERISLIWPTPSTAFFEGRASESFVQPTASGIPDSGQFGCRRSGGAQFHEGLDIRPTKRNRQGEPTDPVFAVMAGVVRHISRVSGNSNYGRYVVIEHPDATPSVYTLYAHLAAVPSSLKVGDTVSQGETVGTMGRSSSTMAIPKDRAHLHFEIGLWMTRGFQGWYNRQKFGSANDHGLWNGMNLMGFDPLEFYEKWRSKQVNDFAEFFARMTPAVIVRVSTRLIPDFVERYPALLTKPLPNDHAIGGWEVTVNEMGLPFRLTPLSPTEVAGLDAGAVSVIQVNEDALKRYRCKKLAFAKRGGWAVGKDLDTVLELLFGIK